MKIYCDTNVYMDYFEDRKDRLRPLAYFAFEFFSRGWNCRFNLIISDHLLNELNRNLRPDQISEIIDEFKKKDKLIHIEMTGEDKEEARKISKENYADALHAVLAKKASADYLTTRNIKDYAGCENLVEIALPELI